jgi:hypothetical protein
MSVPTSNTQYTNSNTDITYGSVSKGSIILPSGAIVPYAGFGNYNSTTPTTSVPSGFLFCDNYWYNPEDPRYIDLFNVIGYTYGSVDYNVGYVPNTSTEITEKYFRTPNIMNQAQTYVFTNQYTGVVRADNPDNLVNNGTPTYAIIGSSYNYITSTNTVTLTVDQLPSHSHSQNAVTNAGTQSAGATILEENGNTTVNSSSTGGNQPFTLPTTPSFAMTYLIKL